MFNFREGRFGFKKSNKLEKDPKTLDIDKEIAKTQQHGDEIKKSQNLKKEEGKMFGNPYGENDYNIPGHEDDERLKQKSDYIDPNDPNAVADINAENAIYKQADSKEKELEEIYDHEDEFKRQAKKILNANEFEYLSSFLKQLEDEKIRKDYIGYKNERGTFIPASKWTPREITNLIKRVNKQPLIIETAKYKDKYDDENNFVKTETETKKIPADQVRFKVKGFNKKEKKKVA